LSKHRRQAVQPDAASGKRPTGTASPDLLWTAVVVLLGTTATAAAVQSVLDSEALAKTMVSGGLWQRLVGVFGGTLQAVDQPGAGRLVADVPFSSVFAPLLVWSAATTLAGGWWLARRRGCSLSEAVARWGLYGWLWWLVPGVWELTRVVAVLSGTSGLEAFVLSVPHLVLGVCVAGWLSTLLTLAAVPAAADTHPPKRLRAKDDDGRSVSWVVWAGLAVYVLVFTTMNWQLYRGLLVPHGDSAMYEEHLWNLLHGKGFRSYLDQGLFLGEHIQVAHLLLIPLYVVWPSHLLLELCESVALALGVVPVFWLARRHTGSHRLAAALAVAYLLYFPMHFLDIAIDLKTFRPISFGVPFLLFALDELERRHWRLATVWILLTLTAKEDFALVLAPLGLWLAWTRSNGQPEPAGPACGDERRQRGRETRQGETASSCQALRRASVRCLFGWALATSTALYLLLVVFVVLPWFRGGAQPHYAHYFGNLGGSVGEILLHCLANPLPVVQKLFSLRSTLYFLSLLLPVGLLPLLSPSRLAVGAPFFAMLCLLEISPNPQDQGQYLVPYHHFHAPLIPIVFWAAAGGLGNLVRGRGVVRWGRRVCQKLRKRHARNDRPHAASPRFAANLAWTCALSLGAFFTLSPLGLSFWDPYSNWYWQKLYVPGKRAEMFERVFRLIPKNACVASTDYVHPRFTHHKRSYDYSHYLRKVSHYQPTVPDDTDYIVIDTRHPYSEIKRPEQVRELREHPDQWQLLPDVSDGYFIVLKRVRHAPARPHNSEPPRRQRSP